MTVKPPRRTLAAAPDDDFHSFTPHKTWPGWATLTKANFAAALPERGEDLSR